MVVPGRYLVYECAHAVAPEALVQEPGVERPASGGHTGASRSWVRCKRKGPLVVEDRGHGEVVAGALLGLAVEPAGAFERLGGDGLGGVDLDAVRVQVQAGRVEQAAGGDDLVEDL